MPACITASKQGAIPAATAVKQLQRDAAGPDTHLRPAVHMAVIHERPAPTACIARVRGDGAHGVLLPCPRQVGGVEQAQAVAALAPPPPMCLHLYVWGMGGGEAASCRGLNWMLMMGRRF